MYGLHMALGRQAAVILNFIHEGGRPTARFVAEAFVWPGGKEPVEALRVTGPTPNLDLSTLPPIVCAERDRTGVEAYPFAEGEIQNGVLLAAMEHANGAAVNALQRQSPGRATWPPPLFRTTGDDWAKRYAVPPARLIRLAAFYRPILESIENHSLSTEAKLTAKWSLRLFEGTESGPAQ